MAILPVVEEYSLVDNHRNITPVDQYASHYTRPNTTNIDYFHRDIEVTFSYRSVLQK